MVNEVFLRYGVTRRIISDNGTQFISSVMQKICYCLDIQQRFTPVYHPSANMVERKNRDLKTQLSILVGQNHQNWPEKLPSIRFALNTARCQSTGYSAAYLTFGREPRTPYEIVHDFRTIARNENFIPEVTPLLKMVATFQEARDTEVKEQDRQKAIQDRRRQPRPTFEPGDKDKAKLLPDELPSSLLEETVHT
ncbi:uncharacterized protein K02A2.6-like [Agrilus planipennis]|uniref:Uncharacterized protein K02A2.6-like n=1 Tax=Agrilus planipennis TaxID=224129 RepID=A0A1W4W2N9_AGRPL|nr:uncharacterized protein K02A2.6-like [Agrilus planipennis]